MTDHAHRIPQRRSKIDEDALAARIQSGDEGALRSVIDAYWKPLVSYAARLLGDHDAAKDVVQESLSHFWVARDHLAVTTSLEAYLFRAVHNRALDERRRVTRRLRLLESRPRDPPGVSTTPEPQQERLPLLLEQAIASLPERRRQIFILAHLHDLTYRQIAEILDLSSQTVANQVSRALADLRRQLAPHAAELAR